MQGDGPQTNGGGSQKKTMKTQSSTQGAGLRNRAEQPGSDGRVSRHAQRLWNRALPTEVLLKLLASRLPEVFQFTEVVGCWVWVQFQQVPTTELRRQLAQLGFHWNRTRQAWQHPCGCFRDRAYAGDPRRFYGSYFPAAVKPL